MSKLNITISIVSVHVDGCSIVSNSPDTAGEHSRRSRLYSTYSCLSNESNNIYNIHVISVHQASDYYFGYYSTVSLNVNGSLSDKPLILAFVSYEPVQWILHIPEGVVVSKVILVSLMLDILKK